MTADHLSRLEKTTEEEKGGEIEKTFLISSHFCYQSKHPDMLIL